MGNAKDERGRMKDEKRRLLLGDRQLITDYLLLIMNLLIFRRVADNIKRPAFGLIIKSANIFT